LHVYASFTFCSESHNLLLVRTRDSVTHPLPLSLLPTTSRFSTGNGKAFVEAFLHSFRLRGEGGQYNDSVTFLQ
jgi:hypothetical protein